MAAPPTTIDIDYLLADITAKLAMLNDIATKKSPNLGEHCALLQDQLATLKDLHASLEDQPIVVDAVPPADPPEDPFIKEVEYHIKDLTDDILEAINEMDNITMYTVPEFIKIDGASGENTRPISVNFLFI